MATYTKSFKLPKGDAPLLLDLGKVGDLAEVYVNGKLAGSVWHAPYRLDIGRAVRRGSQMVNAARAIPRLQVPEYNWWSEALHGIMVLGRAVTVFPEPIGLAASFDTPLIKDMAASMQANGRTGPRIWASPLASKSPAGSCHRRQRCSGQTTSGCSDSEDESLSQG